MEKIIVILRPNGLKKLNMYKNISLKGYKVALVVDSYDEKYEEICDYIIESNINNINQLILDLIYFEQTHSKIVGITSFTEFAIGQASLLAEIFNLPGTSYNSIMIARNKFLTKYNLIDKNVALPKFKLIKKLEDLTNFVEGAGLPLIIKPLESSGSLGVYKIEHSDEVVEVFGKLQALKSEEFESLLGRKLEKAWIAEEYIEGFEISVESYTYNSKTTIVAIHDKINEVEAPYFLEEFFITPSKRIGVTLEKTIHKAVKTILNSVNFTNGITHIEFRIRNGIPYLIEINPRPGGILVVESVYYSTGVNLIDTNIDICAGIKPNTNSNETKPVAFRSINPPLGKIVSITPKDEIPVSHNIKIVEIKSKVGDIVENRSSTQAINILATGRPIDELIKELNSISESISIIVE